MNGSVVVFKNGKKKRHVRIGPNKQSVFIEKGQVAHVVLPNEEKLIINAKDCIICMENKRETKFSCGHFVTCEKCYSLIDICPVCREGKTIEGKYDELQTFNNVGPYDN